MYGNRKKKRTYSVFMILLIFQLCFGMPGIFSEKVYSDELDKGKLDIPGNIQISATANTIALKWNPVAEAESYDIEMNGSVTEGIKVNEHIFERLEPNTEYVVRIRAANEEQTSEWSDQLVCKIFEAEPIQNGNSSQESPDPEIRSGEFARPSDAIREDELDEAESDDPENDITVTEYVYGGTEPVNPVPVAEQTIFDGNGLLGEYYNNIDLTDLALRRIDPEINFSWGSDTPDPKMDDNTFSVRWIGKVQPRYSGKYTFYTLTNNGVRLWVNGKLIIDDLVCLFQKENKGTIELSAGEKYDIKMEYFEGLGKAKAVLSWASKDQKKEVIPQSQLYSPLMAPDDIKAVPSITSVSLKWNEVPGAQSYDIRFNNEMIDSIDSTEYMLENLTAGTEYNISIRAIYSFGTSDWSKNLKISTLEDQEALKGNGNGLTGEYYDNIIFKKLIFKRVDRQINFDWGNGSPDPSIKKNTFSVRWKGKILPQYTAKYTIYLYSDDGAKLWINGKELIDYWKPHSSKEGSATIELVAGEKYDIEIEYFNVNKEAKIVLYWSNPYESKNIIPMEQLYTKPDIPANVNITAEGSDITLSWDNTPGAESYQLEADGAVIDNITDSQYVHKVMPNTEHKYRVRAINEVSSGDWTETFVKVSAPATPENLSAVVDTTNIQISWDAVEAATGYDIEVDGNIIDNSSSTSYVHGGLNTNTKCTYRVRAKNENGASAWTEMLVKTTLPATPQNISIDPTYNRLKLSWDPVDGAISYDIEADGQIVDGIHDTSHTFESLAPDTAYTYRVRARNIEGSGYWSELVTEKTLLETPSGITSDITDRSVSVAWLPVAGATGYDIEIDGNDIEYTTELAFIDEGLSPNSEHSYRIRAKSDDNFSEWSEKITRLTLPDIPKNLASDSTSYAVELKWEEVPGAASYEIEADGHIIDSVADTAYVHKDLQPMTEYSYRVRAKSTAGHGYWSQPIFETTKVGVPENINAVSTSRTITFQWDPVIGAEGYEIELDGIICNNDSGTVYEYIELIPNSPHEYRVRAINDMGNGDWSKLRTKYTAPDIPANITAISTSTSIELIWDAVEAAAGYDVEVQGTPIDNGNNTTYSQNGLNPNTQRTYRIRAKNENGIGDWSSIIAKSTLTGIPVNLSTISTETSIKLLWDAVAGAAGYDVEADGEVIENILLNEYSLSDLAPNTSHNLRVRAKNEDGSGDWSILITAYTLPIAPTITAAEASDTSIKIAWIKIDEVMSYDIEADGLIIDIGKDNEFTHQNLLPNTEHIYRVRAKNGSSISSWSEAVKKLTLPDAPKNLSATATSNSVGLAWDKVEGAIEYEVEADGIVIAAVTDNKYLHENLTPNKEHIYKVRARSEAGAGKWSEEARAFTLLSIPSNIKCAATSTAITLTWDEADGADAYEIEADGSIFEKSLETKYEHTSLMPNTIHLYRIRAKKAGATGDWSEYVTANTLIASVAEIKAVSTNTAIAFTWTPVGDAESYDVETDGNIVSGILEPAYKLEGLVPNTPHTFKVMAKSAENTSDWSAVIIKYTAPDVPANIKTESTTSTIKTVWEAVYGAVGYDIEIDGAAIDNGVNLSYLHGELAPNTKHIYRVRAKNEHEAGPWSQEIAGTTEPELTFNCSEDSLFNFVIAAPKMEEIAERSITVTYNAEELEAVDLCAATAKQDIEIGDIQGTNLEVREFTPGTIVFSLKDPSKAIMNAVKFKAKINGQSKIIYVIEQ